MKRKIGLLEVKNALLDDRFRKSLPSEFTPDVDKFLSNPGCACNHPIYRKIAMKCSKELSAYFPQMDVMSEEEFEEKNQRLLKNNWQVINCHVSELADQLKKLGSGRKQLDIARYQDQVTVVINHLDVDF